MSHLDERQLTERAKQGDRDAFRAIVERYKRELFALTYRMTSHHQDAEDLLQKAFLKAYKALNGFRAESSLKSWLYRITLNVCLDHKRQQKPVISLHQDEESKRLDPPEGNPEANPDRVLSSQSIKQHIFEATQQLSPLEQSVFVLRHQKEHSLKEIAAILSRSEGTVKNVLFRAIRKMRHQLQPLYRPTKGVS